MAFWQKSYHASEHLRMSELPINRYDIPAIVNVALGF